MDQLIDKIAFLLLPANFAKIMPYCFWYWLMITAIVIFLFRKK
jgi:hypothetical protein